MSMKNQGRKYNTIIQQDECAPDAMIEFNKQFFAHFKCSLKEFIKGVVPKDLGDTDVYEIDNYLIINEIGYWTVKQLEV